MVKRNLLLATVLFLLTASVALAAGPVKYTFNDVTFPDTTTGEIEATSKTGYTTCRYFSDDYLTYLGGYDEAVGFGDGPAVLQHCLDNYDNRTP